MSEPQRPIDTALFDQSIAASDDFYRHVNGGWLDANPVPSEYGAWGAPQIVPRATRTCCTSCSRTQRPERSLADRPARWWATTSPPRWMRQR